MKSKSVLCAILALAVAAPLSRVFAEEEDKKDPGNRPKPGGPGAQERRGPGGPGGPGGRGGFSIEAIDKDKSGDISEEEFIAFHVERAKRGFGFMDKNKDGKLTKEELPRPGQQRPGGPPQRRGSEGPGDKDKGDGEKPKRPPVDDSDAS